MTESVWIATPYRVPNDRRWWFEALAVFFAKTMERARCHGHPFDLRTGIDSRLSAGKVYRSNLSLERNFREPVGIRPSPAGT